MGEMTAEGVQVIRTETMIQEMTENMNIVLRQLGNVVKNRNGTSIVPCVLPDNKSSLFCPAERRSAGQNAFRDPEVPDYIYRRYIYTEVTIHSARQNAVLTGRTLFGTRRCQIIYIGDIYVRI